MNAAPRTAQFRTGALAFALTVALPALPAQPAQQDPARKAARLAAALGTDPGAAGELFRCGGAAVPALLPFLQKPDLWDEQTTAAQPRAIHVLRDLGPDAGDAVDALVDCLGAPEWKEQRGDLFAAIGAIAPWLERRAEISRALGNGCDKGHYFGEGGFFALISRLTFDARGDRAALLPGLEDDNLYVRELAAEALARDLRLHPPDDRETRQLGQQLRSALAEPAPTEFKVSWAWNGKTCQTSGGVDDPHRFGRALATALAALDPEAREAAPGHVQRLQHVDPRVRIEALRALGGLGEAAADAVPAMIAALRSGEPQVAREAATMLGVLGPVAKAAKDALTEASRSDDKQLAVSAQAALRRLP
jgi:hypothetical protein